MADAVEQPSRWRAEFPVQVKRRYHRCLLHVNPCGTQNDTDRKAAQEGKGKRDDLGAPATGIWTTRAHVVTETKKESCGNGCGTCVAEPTQREAEATGGPVLRNGRRFEVDKR